MNTHKDMNTCLKALVLLPLLFVFFSSARAEDYHLTVGQFRKINVSDDINVVYRCVPDSTGTVAFSGDRRFANAIMFSVDKNTLKIRVSTEAVGDKDLPTVYAYSDYLTDATNSGKMTLRVENPAPCPEFKATVVGNGTLNAVGISATSVTGKLTTGNGTVTMAGKADTAEYLMLGTGAIQADLMQADIVKCKCLGSGTIGCWALSTLKAQCLGSTKIYYRGDPEVSKKGGGKLIPIED